VTVFVDTSAFYALLDGDDDNNPAAAAEWERILGAEISLVTTAFVLVETLALLQHRIGLDAVQAFHEDVYPLLHVEWIGETDYEAGANAVLSAQRRDLSLVDCVSFVLMRRLGLRRVFAFDHHFGEQGFECVPAPLRR
jgi:predicted nucleic acid-binding protein